MQSLSVEQAAKIIRKNIGTGKERGVNESLYFGCGLYGYAEDVNKSGLTPPMDITLVFSTSI